MPSETKLHHLTTALLVGEGIDSLAAPLQAAQDAGWSLNRAGDVYAATAWLLAAARHTPDVVLVLVESLRSDELRFLDLLSRRWPGLPAAAVYTTSAQDRRLEACRRRGVTVLPAQGLVEWLAGRRPDSTPLPEPGHPVDVAPVEVELDMAEEVTEPPELTETQPDLEEAQAELAEQAEYGGTDRQEQEEDSAAGLPLTPWSLRPRPQRRRVSRVPPARSERASPPAPAVPGTPNPQSAPRSSPGTPNPETPTRSFPTRDWEHGLLTPDELRALLDDSEETAGPQEDQP